MKISYILPGGFIIILALAMAIESRSFHKNTPVFNTKMVAIPTAKPTSVIVPTLTPDIKEVKSTSGYTSGSEMLRLINEQRASYHVAPLVEIAVLDRAALLKAQDLQHSSFSHTDSMGRDFTGFFKDAGWYGLDAQDLAWLRPHAIQADIVWSWMASPDHKANILDYRAVYFGYAQVGLFAVADFGN